MSSQSIKTNLINLLNSRQGSLQHLPDYGLPDLVDIYQALPGSINQLIQSIQTSIEKYEPRLQFVRVLNQSSQSQAIISLEIKAQLITGENVCFNTHFQSGGKVKL